MPRIRDNETLHLMEVDPDPSSDAGDDEAVSSPESAEEDADADVDVDADAALRTMGRGAPARRADSSASPVVLSPIGAQADAYGYRRKGSTAKFVCVVHRCLERVERYFINPFR